MSSEKQPLSLSEQIQERTLSLLAKSGLFDEQEITTLEDVLQLSGRPDIQAIERAVESKQKNNEDS
jgi:hypothetical protein